MASILEAIRTASLREPACMLEASLDVQFQAWIALSFAVIGAIFFVGSCIGKLDNIRT